MKWNDDLVKKFARVYCGNDKEISCLGLDINEKLNKFKEEITKMSANNQEKLLIKGYGNLTDIEWFRNALNFVSNRDADLFNDAIKYADEKEEGCI